MQRARELARQVRHQLLGVAHHLLDAREGTVPLEHGELGLVALAQLVVAEALGELIDALEAAREQPLHLVLGAGDQVALALPSLHGHRIEVHVEPGARHHQRRLDLEEVLLIEEGAHRAQQLRALPEPRGALLRLGEFRRRRTRRGRTGGCTSSTTCGAVKLPGDDQSALRRTRLPTGGGSPCQISQAWPLSSDRCASTSPPTRSSRTWVTRAQTLTRLPNLRS